MEKKFVIMYANKMIAFVGEDRAREQAKNISKVNFRAYVFDGNKKIAFYEWGEEKAI